MKMVKLLKIDKTATSMYFECRKAKLADKTKSLK